MADHHHHDHSHVTPDMTHRHATGWQQFMRATTYGIIAVVALLILMKLFLT